MKTKGKSDIYFGIPLTLWTHF